MIKKVFVVGQHVAVKVQGTKHTGVIIGYEDMYDEYIVKLDTNGQKVQVKAEALS